MDFALPDTTEDFRRELARWTDRRPVRPGFDRQEWEQFAERGLLRTQEGETVLDTVVGFMEVARKGLPGPLFEARLAESAAGPGLSSELEKGSVVTGCVERAGAGPVPVGWGAVADVVVDLAGGGELGRGGLPHLHTSYLHPHGWWTGARPAALPTPEQRALRWTLGGALLTGLALGAVDLTRDYVAQRVQFGRAIGTFQAVQFPLAEAKVSAEGLRLMVLDAAWRITGERPDATVAAALLAVNAARLTKQVGDICHHAFGANGHTNEAFLNELTWGMRWLRGLLGVDAARAAILERRVTHSSPPSLVLAGFRHEDV
ncbi:hypothetical protein PSU4_01680 [Pseudonocardia sulfidoxydans NBRC 16205]|uniref:Acyl-CoA dehydrogenase/oxidase C-terminal domain-containing protein n=2 Tax=Pseudonocardia sulfidoxydans TaxID=54011 RepID=A0A511DC16_9PSEU|nr:acyl-CoA dehydrogenase family protein [Pseudonocardia sulfidoxydans]GEL21214.1 hypothetical protein PSU4_01680 [Pseudonocardia sulfidoxydans NBRC 16205]